MMGIISLVLLVVFIFLLNPILGIGLVLLGLILSGNNKNF